MCTYALVCLYICVYTVGYKPAVNQSHSSKMSSFFVVLKNTGNICEFYSRMLIII